MIFKTNPWEHQKLALEYLMERDRAALYTDMGTGKSKVMIDLIVNRGFGVTMIVCTNKGCEVWEKQFKIHSYFPTECVLSLSGISTKEKIQVMSESMSERGKIQNKHPLVFIVNYEGVWRDELAKYLMRKTVQIDCVICDESHRIKSPGSKCSRFLSRLGKKVKHRYLVTGTPLADNPMDAYAQYRFLDPSIFGYSFSKFKDNYQNLDVRLSTAVGFPVLDRNQPYKNLDDLREKVFSIAFKIPSSVKLPKMNNRIRHFTLSEKASRVYNKLCKEGVLTHGDWYCEAENALTLQIRKKQIASGFVATVNDVEERKNFRLDDSRADTLVDILESLDPDEPVVVFAQYTHDLKKIRKACKSCGRGYSELSGREDTENVWQKGKTTVLGVQFSKGSESADFTRARYTIYYTMTNSLALYLQSKKRTNRPGQTRSCYYIHLVADLANGKPTIDTTVMEAIKQKRDIIDYVMEKEASYDQSSGC